MRRLLTIILSLWCWPALAQLSSGLNPQPGWVWTYQGPTLGGSFQPPFPDAPKAFYIQTGIDGIRNSDAPLGNSTYFWTNAPSHAMIERVQDRLFVGAAAAANSGDQPETTKDWLELRIPSTTQNAQLSVLNTLGLIAIVGGTRTSDFPALSGGSIGVAGYALNDQLGFASSAYGSYFHAVRYLGVTGYTHGIEAEAVNLGAPVGITPWTMIQPGLTSSLWLGSGGGDITALNPISVYIGIVPNTTKALRGIAIAQNAIDSTGGGHGGNGIALSLATGHSITWDNSVAATSGDVWYDETGGLNLLGGQLTSPVTHTFWDQLSRRILVLRQSTTPVNYLLIDSGNTGISPIIRVDGSDTNIDVAVAPKGTGKFKMGYNTTAAAVPGNFAANRIFEFKDGAGVSFYVPAMTATW